MTLADILRGGLYAIDTPGALTRGAIANLADLIRGQDQHQGYRATGREMLESMGVVGENQSGLDWGDVAGLGADVAVDPLNLVGGGALAKILKTGKAARANNALRADRLATGGMPEEVAKLTKAVDASGKPLRTYHGTAHAFDKYDMAQADPLALYGKGIYTTDAGDIADGYTGADLTASSGPDARWLYDTLVSQGRQPNVRMHYLDVRTPLDLDSAPGLANQLEGSPHLAPQRLRRWGYDSMRHEGGRITGGKSHDVWIATDPSQVYSPWLAPAEQAVPRVSPLASILAVYNAQKAYPRQ